MNTLALRQYHFVTTFTIDSSLTSVWNLLIDIDGWNGWWRGARTIRENDTKALLVVGNAVYKLHIMMEQLSAETGRSIVFAASGDLVGTGMFTVTESTIGTTVIFDWQVATTKKWMNVIAPIARSIFVASHNHVMDNFAKGMAHRLNVQIDTFRSTNQ